MLVGSIKSNTGMFISSQNHKPEAAGKQHTALYKKCAV